MTSTRRVLVLSVAAAAILATAACAASGGPTANPPTGSTPTVVLGDGGSGQPTTAAPTTAVPPSYPSSARGYGEAILAAWKSNQPARLGALTSPEVQEQILEIPGPINQVWHYNRCEGAAGSSYCVFFNDPGDMITLKVTNMFLGKPHAGTQVIFDQVTFPSDPVEYVKKFVGAWQDGNTYRMKILSNQAEVDYFTHYTPPEPGTDACYSGGAAGSQYVRVYNGDGLEYLLRVTSATLGKQHAIAGHNDPSGSNCI